MAGLTPEDLVDLGRWHAIQWGSREAAQAALDRYERFRARLARRGALAPHPDDDDWDTGWLEEPPGGRAA